MIARPPFADTRRPAQVRSPMAAATMTGPVTPFSRWLVEAFAVLG